MGFRPASSALGNVTVLDLTRVRAGPACVRQLSDWGADVIRVELRESDRAQSAQTDFSPRHDADFQNLQRGKRSIAIDLKKPEGRAVLLRLVEKADVLVENFRPSVKHRLKIDYDILREINPRLVYASISGFGEDGPYRDRPGVDQIAQGMSGLMSITGEPGRGPMRVGIALADLAAGIFAASGILVALHERQTSGQGQWVQASLLQALIFLLDFQGARYLMKNEIAEQAGNNHPTAVPTNTFRTRDGYINLAPTPPMWPRFCKAIEREDLIRHPDYATAAARRDRQQEVNALIEGITAQKDTAIWVEHFNTAGIPCGPIYSIEQTFADPQVRHLEVWQGVSSGVLGEISVLAQPFSLSRTPSRLTTAAPEYAEHTDEILAEISYTAEEIAKLRSIEAI